MKRIIAALSAVLILISLFSGCAKKDEKPESVLMPTVLNTIEYTLYQNIFYKDKASEYESQETEKEGTFTTLYDAYSDKERYYVWGYNDNTKCCDWQWELKITDKKSLPVNGSLVTVKGTYESSEEALDKFWIVNPEITVKTKYKGNDYDIDMLTMGATLERVQITNVLNFPDYFKGKTIGFYGRMKNDTSIEDPYYNGSWSATIDGDYEVPAYGTMVIAEGKIDGESITEVKLSKNTQY